MNFLNQLFSEELIYALGWTVVHSLWQAIAVAALMTILMIGLRDKSAKLRYAIANFSLLAVLLLSATTFLQLYHIGTTNQSEVITLIISGQTEIISLNTNTTSSALTGLGHFFDTNMPFIVLAWFMGIIFFTIRLMGGFVFIQYLRSTYISLPETWQDKMYNLMDAIPMYRAVELAESALVRVPMVVGHIKPLILLPLGTINQLEIEEVEAIIAHELAHIVRNDYFFNILQSIVEILFYYNPSVWWISANIRTERENCCDDMAIKLCGNSLAYAKALVKIQEIQHYNPRLAMTFAGNKNQLLNRVKRILNQQQNKSMTMEKLLATCLLLLTAGIFTINANTNMEGVPLEIKELTPRTIEELPSPEFEELIEKRGEKKLKPTKIITLSNPSFKESNFNQPTVIVLDTLPKNNSSSHSRQRIKRKTDNENVDISIVNGEIKKLIIDGERIAKEDYPKYQQYVDDLANDIPEPPTPPSSINIPVPPVPPAPPAPPVRTIRKSKSSTSTSISIDSDEGVTSAMINGYELKREKGPDGKMRTYWDGKEIENNTITKWEDGKLITKQIGDARILSLEDANIYIKTDENGNTQAYSFDLDLDLENASDEEILAKIEAIHEDRATEMEIRKMEMKQREKEMLKRAEEMKIRAEEMKEREKEMLERAKEMKIRAEERAIGFEDEVQSIFTIEGDWKKRLEVQTEDASKKMGEILYEEGLIEDPNDYSFTLKRKKITVNGKTITGAQVEKIRDLMTRRMDMTVSKNSTMKIHRGNNRSRTSIKQH